ncbi:MAG TPA: N-acetylmuramoyl-L-alanine amidase-like domain-containing protein [Armatimonadota bacterium]|nr:N-acetylmuramoyl-L-alanine amidase-like domain-containing protein [Armatimonadota bacterium]
MLRQNGTNQPRSLVLIVSLVLFGLSIVLGISSPIKAAVDMSRQNASKFTAEQWSGAFQIANALPFSQRVAFWSDLTSVDSTYVLDPLGEGPAAAPDNGPLYDFAHVDCVTFVEQVYALALSNNYRAFQDTLQHIRYRNGQIDYRWRNHYLVSDWLPANAWFIHDITDDVGGQIVKPMTKTITRGKFFADKGLQQYANLPDETATVSYIPRDQVASVLTKIHTGDMLIFVINSPGIIAGHTGLAIVRGTTVYVRHASQTAKTVVTVPLADYMRTMPDRFVGFKVARPSQTTTAVPQK